PGALPPADRCSGCTSRRSRRTRFRDARAGPRRRRRGRRASRRRRARRSEPVGSDWAALMSISLNASGTTAYVHWVLSGLILLHVGSSPQSSCTYTDVMKDPGKLDRVVAEARRAAAEREQGYR